MMRFLKLLQLMVLIGEAVFSIQASAVLPPAYLSIPQFKACLGTVSKGTWTAYCLPKRRPKGCSIQRWHRIKQSAPPDQCPPVQQSSHCDHPSDGIDGKL